MLTRSKISKNSELCKGWSHPRRPVPARHPIEILRPQYPPMILVQRKDVPPEMTPELPASADLNLSGGVIPNPDIGQAMSLSPTSSSRTREALTENENCFTETSVNSVNACGLIPLRGPTQEFHHNRRAYEIRLAFGKNSEPTNVAYREIIRDFIRSMKDQEHKRILYYGISPQVSSRRKLFDFVSYIAREEGFCNSTLVHTMYLFDRILEKHSIVDGQLNILALTCLILAGKLEENDSKSPKFYRLRRYMPLAFQKSCDCYLEMESLVLKFFNFDLLVPTEAMYVRSYLMYGLDGMDWFYCVNNNPMDVSVNHPAPTKSESIELLEKIRSTTNKVIVMLLRDPPPLGTFRTGARSRTFTCSLVSAAILMYARREHKLNFWTHTLEYITGHSHFDVCHCLKMHVELCARISNNVSATKVFQRPSFIDK